MTQDANNIKKNTHKNKQKTQKCIKAQRNTQKQKYTKMRKRQNGTKRSKPKHKRHEIKQQINKRETIQKIKHKKHEHNRNNK